MKALTSTLKRGKEKLGALSECNHSFGGLLATKQYEYDTVSTARRPEKPRTATDQHRVNRYNTTNVGRCGAGR